MISGTGVLIVIGAQERVALSTFNSVEQGQRILTRMLDNLVQKALLRSWKVEFTESMGVQLQFRLLTHCFFDLLPFALLQFQ